MTSLRNLWVHDYADVDVQRLAAIIAADLDDLRAFAQVASRRLAADASR